MVMRKTIPRIVIAGTQSGSGKTTLVTGLLAALRAKGLRVQSYKVGPDYIDPGFHALASGRPAHNLDTWLVGEERLPALFAESIGDADIAVIEGVMGLYDGGRKGVSSTAAVAKLLHAPVLLAIDCKSMGASAAAVALGFRAYDKETDIAGVLLNRLGSPTHEQMIRAAMEGIDMPVYGAVHRDDRLHLPERHLGLTPTTENDAADVVKKMGEDIGAQVNLEKLVELAKRAERMTVSFAFEDNNRAIRYDLPSTLPQSPAATAPPKEEPWERYPQPPSSREGDRVSGGGSVEGTAEESVHNSNRRTELRIAVAQDAAFSFYYPTSLAVLERFGATLVPFSPLEDRALPENISGALFGGGFPEMFAEQLAANTSMRESIRTAADAGLPIYAECGGYMYLLSELVDFEGRHHSMCGVFPGRTAMTKRLQMVGYVTARMVEDTILGPAGTEIRGHEFHFSQEEEDAGQRPFTFTKLRNSASYAAGQMHHHALGSYLHLHFAGCPDAAKQFLDACAAWQAGKEGRA